MLSYKKIYWLIVHHGCFKSGNIYHGLYYIKYTALYYYTKYFTKYAKV